MLKRSKIVKNRKIEHGFDWKEEVRQCYQAPDSAPSRWSMVDGRWSMVAKVRWSAFGEHGWRSRVYPGPQVREMTVFSGSTPLLDSIEDTRL